MSVNDQYKELMQSLLLGLTSSPAQSILDMQQDALEGAAHKIRTLMQDLDRANAYSTQLETSLNELRQAFNSLLKAYHEQVQENQQLKVLHEDLSEDPLYYQDTKGNKMSMADFEKMISSDKAREFYEEKISEVPPVQSEVRDAYENAYTVQQAWLDMTNLKDQILILERKLSERMF
jgi:hypothetical protein